MSRNFSRDETEWGDFGDSWGATLSLAGTGLAPATATQKAANPINATTMAAAKAKPAVYRGSVSVAAPVALSPSLASVAASRGAPQSALSAALSQVAPKTPIVPKALSAPVASLVSQVKPAPVAPPKPVAPSSSGAVDPRTLDFMTGQSSLSATGNVKAPIVAPVVLSKDQQLAANAARVRAAAAQTSNINVQGGYTAARAAADQDTLRFNQEISKAAWNNTDQDWGLIPLGAAVLATGAAVIATAGTAGAAIAAGGVSTATIGSVVTADGVLAAAAKVGGKDAAKAKAVIDSTKALAAGGNVDARKGLTVLAAVTADRKAKGIADGVTQSVDSLLPLATNPIIAEATAGGGLALRADPPGAGGGAFTTDQLAALAPKTPIVSTAKAPDLRLASDTVALTPAQAAAAADHRLRWTVLNSGKLYRGPAPSGAGGQFRVYDSGRVEQTAT